MAHQSVFKSQVHTDGQIGTKQKNKIKRLVYWKLTSWGVVGGGGGRL